MLMGCSVDANNPQSTEVTLPPTAVTVGIGKRSQHRLISPAEIPMPGIVVAFRQLQNLFMTFMGPGASFNP